MNFMLSNVPELMDNRKTSPCPSMQGVSRVYQPEFSHHITPV